MPDSIALAVASFGVGEFSYSPVIASSSWATSYVSPVYYSFAGVSFSADNLSHASYTLITDASFELPSYQSTYLFGNVILSAYVFTEPPLTYTGNDATKRGSALVSIEPSITATGGIVLRGAGTVDTVLEITGTGRSAVLRGDANVELITTITSSGTKTIRGDGNTELSPSITSSGRTNVRAIAGAIELNPSLSGTASVTIRGIANVQLSPAITASAKVAIRGTATVSLEPAVEGYGKVPLTAQGVVSLSGLTITGAGYLADHRGIVQLHMYPAITSAGQITYREHYGVSTVSLAPAITASGKTSVLRGAGSVSSSPTITATGRTSTKRGVLGNVACTLQVTATGTREQSTRLVVDSSYSLILGQEFASTYSLSLTTVEFTLSYADYAELNVEMSYGMAATITGDWAASYHLLQNSTATYELKYTLLAVNDARQEFSFSYSMADTLPYEPPVPPGFQIPPPIPVE